MTARRLLGYIVKLPDGTRSPETPKPVGVVEVARAYGNASLGTYFCPVFATRKPKPAPADASAEGLFAVLTEDSGDAHFQDINDGRDGFPRDAQRSIGSREMAVAFVGRWPGNKLVRVLDDGAHEAAVESARREERERVAALLATEAERLDIGCEEAGVYLRAAEIAKKGQAK